MPRTRKDGKPRHTYKESATQQPQAMPDHPGLTYRKTRKGIVIEPARENTSPE